MKQLQSNAFDRRGDYLALQAEDDLPIVVAKHDLWYSICHYGPPELARRCVYAADPERSRYYLGHNTVDRCGLALEKWFATRMQPYRDVLAYERFYLYSDLNAKWNWLPSALLADRAHVELLTRRRGFVMALVTPRRHSMGEPAAALTSPNDKMAVYEGD